MAFKSSTLLFKLQLYYEYIVLYFLEIYICVFFYSYLLSKMAPNRPFWGVNLVENIYYILLIFTYKISKIINYSVLVGR